jgi:hypothetical protein
MKPRELAKHKSAPKSLATVPTFKPLKKNKLPKPLSRIGGGRVKATELLRVSPDHLAILVWRDGEILTDRAFFGFLFCTLASGALSPVFEFHWHPSHKGIHCKVPCNTSSDYTNRFLPGAPELNLKTPSILDPRSENDRLVLIHLFCKACGISLPETDQKTLALW